ncbi:MAG: 1,4-alpha-glucan branching protein GlgB [Clostridiales bacterium]|jgi:1,4-alpha-glucan branching enzyme|nr:1,4-alpha-glucan branching protein GlgB [Clostridiales bacterium]
MPTDFALQFNNSNDVSAFQLHLFNEGTNYCAYKMLGAHQVDNGYHFSVWAPNAKQVSVVGEFNDWNSNSNVMNLISRESGVWSLQIPDIAPGMQYKFHIITKTGKQLFKADPYAFQSQLRPHTASVTTPNSTFAWTDSSYLNKKTNIYEQPKIIYELHLGSWRRNSNGTFYNYKQMASELIPYVKQSGFTHVELMPICEYPFDGSWGYQVTGFYSVTSRYGTPDDFKFLINEFHKAGIGVILDWVPAHFPKDSHGLADFDGSALYEYSDTRLGEHLEWGTKVFNYKRNEVVSFLISNAMFWLEEFHIDGLRVDAVSSMLYRDYNRKNWLPNEYGGKENIEAIEFFKKLNTVVFEKFPNALMIAEESTAWPNVTKPKDIGGLGFNFKWNMGWMNDILNYMSLDPFFRKDNHNSLTFSMEYAFAENFILPLSHDEVVHGKRSIIDKMSGDYNQKFSTLRAFYGYMMAHPGGKLFFMGDEFAHFAEWDFSKQLDWNLLEYDNHRKTFDYFCDLMDFYKTNPSLWENDRDWNGYKWIKVDDNSNSTIGFIRINKAKDDKIITFCNFTPNELKNYKFSLDKEDNGCYELVFSSNFTKYGGTDTWIHKVYKTVQNKTNKNIFDMEIDIPPMSTIFLKKTPNPAPVTKLKLIKEGIWHKNFDNSTPNNNPEVIGSKGVSDKIDTKNDENPKQPSDKKPGQPKE